MNSTESLPLAVKNSPRSHHRLVTYLYKLADCLTGNASYATPTPSVATIKAAADGLAQANAKARDGGPAVSARAAKRQDAEDLVDHLVTYVRVTVRAQAGDPATATAMILSAGLSVRKRTKPSRAALTATYGPASGEVLLMALAMADAARYAWEYSLDQSIWRSAAQTMKAYTSIPGLTPGQVYAFRFRAQTRKGMSDYSDIVTLMAL